MGEPVTDTAALARVVEALEELLATAVAREREDVTGPHGGYMPPGLDEGFRAAWMIEHEADVEFWVTTRRDTNGRYLFVDAYAALATARAALAAATVHDDATLLCPHGAVACSVCIIRDTSDKLAGRS